MKLDIRNFRYLSPDDWRVLTAAEQGSKNHEIVPTPLIIRIAGLRTGSSACQKSISVLAKADLIARQRNARYDGYRLTYGGLDYLALRAHTNAGAIVHLGSAMGTGKESDIWLVKSPSDYDYVSSSTVPATGAPVESILKIHRLGRVSFRAVTNKRAYQRKKVRASWHYLSRLSAQKEYLAMTALHRAGMRVPRPIAQSRHTVVMSLIPGLPLRQVPVEAFGQAKEDRVPRIAALYAECLELALQMAEVGLIHGDLNEFNILIENVPEPQDDATDHEFRGGTTEAPSAPIKPMIPHMIDFPQVVAMTHPNAAYYFDRDVTGIKAFFRKKYHFESGSDGPSFTDGLARLKSSTKPRLDGVTEAAGFSKKMQRDLELYYDEDANDEVNDGNNDDDDQEDNESGSASEEDETLDSELQAHLDGLDLTQPETNEPSYKPMPGTLDLLGAESQQDKVSTTKAKAGWAI